MSVTVVEVKKVIEKMSNVIIENEVYFCELDSAAGDGDFGMSLSKGFREALTVLIQVVLISSYANAV